MLSSIKSTPLLLFLISLLAGARAGVGGATLPSAALPTSSGYLPVNTTSGSAIYYAFYEAQHSLSPALAHTPLLIWLQGGPGCSSLIGNFFELGPWLVSTTNTTEVNPALSPNPGSWNRLFGLLFLDNPIGTGFSFAAAPDEIPTDQTTVAAHLHSALTSFLDKNPSFRSRPLFITGESYAGKYVPAIASYILDQNPRRPINLQGIVIGNGLTDPATQIATVADTVFYSGLINRKQKTELEQLQAQAIKLIKDEKWAEATNARVLMLEWLQNATGLATLYDLRRQKPYEDDVVAKLLSNKEVKKQLGAKEGMEWEVCSEVVGKALHGDVMKSVRGLVERVVKERRVLLYQGQFDLRDGVVSTEAWVEKMEWEGSEGFKAARRRVWRVGGWLGGYVQQWGRLTEVVVAGAGHLVPADQGLSSQVMIEDWVLQRGEFAAGYNFHGFL